MYIYGNDVFTTNIEPMSYDRFRSKEWYIKTGEFPLFDCSALKLQFNEPKNNLTRINAFSIGKICYKVFKNTSSIFFFHECSIKFFVLIR